MENDGSAGGTACAASTNDKKTPTDGFEFSYFPREWPVAENGVDRELSAISLSANQILELRQYHKHRLSIRRLDREPAQRWCNYFSLDRSKYGSSSSVVRNLSCRKLPGEEQRSLNDLRVYIQTPEKQQKETNESVQENQPESAEKSQENSDSDEIQQQLEENRKRKYRKSEEEISMMLTEDGGPQLLIQLASGEANALNPSAKRKAFQRNKGYGSPLGDQDFSKNIVVQPDMLSSFGLQTFGNFPTLVERDGDRTWLEGIDTTGKPLHLQMDRHPHNTILIDMTSFTTKFLDEYFKYKMADKKVFVGMVTRLVANEEIPAFPVEKQQPRALLCLFRKLLMKVGVFNNIIASVRSHEEPVQYDPLRSQCTGIALVESWELYKKNFDASSPEQQAAACTEMRELELGHTLYFEYYDEKAKAVGEINWEAPAYDVQMLPRNVRRKRQAALISHTTELKPLSQAQVSSHPALEGGGQIPPEVQESLHEVLPTDRFVTRQASMRTKTNAKKRVLRGRRSRRQMSHGDGLACGLFSWHNAGLWPAGIGMHLNSGGTNRIIMKEGQRKQKFDEQMETIKCYGSSKRLIDCMRGSKPEKIATAWTLHCDTKVRRAGAARMWDPKILMVPEMTMVLTSLQNFHFGAEFPIVLPMPEAEEDLQIPGDLWSVRLHDYHGPNSADHESTVDIRSDPILCPGCEYWAGSDDKHSGF